MKNSVIRLEAFRQPAGGEAYLSQCGCVRRGVLYMYLLYIIEVNRSALSSRLIKGISSIDLSTCHILHCDQPVPAEPVASQPAIFSIEQVSTQERLAPGTGMPCHGQLYLQFCWKFISGIRLSQ